MLREEVNDGATPEEVKRFILRDVSADRTGIADRCNNAAKYLYAMKVQA